MAQLRGEHLLLLLGRNEARDVDKGQKHAIDLVVCGAIREDTREIIVVSASMAHRAFRHLLAKANPAHILLQVRIIAAANNISQRSPAVARYQIEQLGDSRGKTANFQISVEEDCRYLCALE